MAELRFFLHASAASLLALHLGGCASTHAGRSVNSWQALQQGRTDAAVHQWNPDGRGVSRTLFRAEAGRTAQLGGDFGESQKRLEQAIEASVNFSDEAVVRLRSVTAELAASSALNDFARPYYLDGFELVMAQVGQSVNYWALGDAAGAQVEMRRTVYIQDKLGDWADQDRSIWQRKLEDQDGEAALQQAREKLWHGAPDLAPEVASSENGYAWYWTGLWYEAIGEPGNAWVSYRRALDAGFTPSALQSDALRLAAQQDPQAYEALQQRFPGAPDPPVGDAPRIVVLLEDGRLPPRVSIDVPLPFGRYWQKLSLPAYGRGGVPVRNWTASTGTEQGQLETLAQVYGLASKALNEEIPGVLARGIVRAVARHAGQEALRRDGNELLAALWNIGSFVVDSADTRAWTNLPRRAQVWRGVGQDGGTHLVLRRDGLARLDVQLPTRAGETWLVWVADAGEAGVAVAGPLAPQPRPPRHHTLLSGGSPPTQWETDWEAPAP